MVPRGIRIIVTSAGQRFLTDNVKLDFGQRPGKRKNRVFSMQRNSIPLETRGIAFPSFLHFDRAAPIGRPLHTTAHCLRIVSVVGARAKAGGRTKQAKN